MRNGGICHSSVQWIHTLVNHQAVHCIRLAVKIFMNFTRVDYTVPFLASHRHSVHSRITVFCCVHTYRWRRTGSISRHGQICSRLGARQLSGTYVPVSYTHQRILRQLLREPRHIVGAVPALRRRIEFRENRPLLQVCFYILFPNSIAPGFLTRPLAGHLAAFEQVQRRGLADVADSEKLLLVHHFGNCLLYTSKARSVPALCISLTIPTPKTTPLSLPINGPSLRTATSVRISVSYTHLLAVWYAPCR